MKQHPLLTMNVLATAVSLACHAAKAEEQPYQGKVGRSQSGFGSMCSGRQLQSWTCSASFDIHQALDGP